MIIAGASAYSRTLDFARFRADRRFGRRDVHGRYGALSRVWWRRVVHPNPCEYADIVTSTTHKTLRGPRAGMILAQGKIRAGDR